MANGLLRFFATGPDVPESTDRGWIDAQFRRHRVRVMLAITLGYALIYTCRLAISMVKKPLIDGGTFTAEQLGVIGSALYFAYAVGNGLVIAVDLVINSAVDFAPIVLALSALPLASLYARLWMAGYSLRDVLATAAQKPAAIRVGTPPGVAVAPTTSPALVGILRSNMGPATTQV